MRGSLLVAGWSLAGLAGCGGQPDAVPPPVTSPVSATSVMAPTASQPGAGPGTAASPSALTCGVVPSLPPDAAAQVRSFTDELAEPPPPWRGSGAADLPPLLSGDPS